MLLEEKNRKLLETIIADSGESTGVTDPAAVSLAAAIGRKHLPGVIKQVNILMSGNLYKNAVGAGIYGTVHKGIEYAAAIGITCGNPDKGLSVLEEINDIAISEAEELLKNARFEVKVCFDLSPLYVRVELHTDHDCVVTIIEDDYTNLKEVSKNGECIYKNNDLKLEKSQSFINELEYDEILQFIETADINDIRFLKEKAEINKRAALKGLGNKMGFNLGITLRDSLKETGNKMIDSYIRARSYTAGAVEARVSGQQVMIFSVVGSGNHGITSTVPILAAAEVENISEERCIRGLALSVLTTIYIKSFIKRMTAFCGCGVAASTGSAAGICWMLGGDSGQIKSSMQSIIGGIAGMICDGAKESCAFKTSAGAGEAVINAYLSLNGVSVNAPSGIVAPNIRDSFINLGKINNPGMQETDKVITQIIQGIQCAF